VPQLPPTKSVLPNGGHQARGGSYLYLRGQDSLDLRESSKGHGGSPVACMPCWAADLPKIWQPSCACCDVSNCMNNPKNLATCQRMQPLINQTEDCWVVPDQQVMDDKVTVLGLGDQFLLEAVEYVYAYHFSGG
jgi:hypothetical protein